MGNKNRILTVSRADVFDTKFNTVVWSVEASHKHHRVIVVETDRVKVTNEINPIEHETVRAAELYLLTLNEK